MMAPRTSPRWAALAALLIVAAQTSTAAAGNRCTARGRVDDGKLAYRYEFDNRGRIVSAAIKVTEDGGGSRAGVEEWSYDPAGRVASYRDQRGTESWLTWDADGKLAMLRVGGTYEWQEVRFTWATGATAVAPSAHAPVRFAWIDPTRGRLYPRLFGGASGTASTEVFECTKAKCRPTDKRGVATYDDRGRLTAMKLDDVETTIRYSSDGPIEMRETDTIPDVTTWSYDRGRLVEVVTATGKTSRTATRITWSKAGPKQRVVVRTTMAKDRQPDGSYRDRPVDDTEPPLVFQGCRF